MQHILAGDLVADKSVHLTAEQKPDRFLLIFRREHGGVRNALHRFTADVAFLHGDFAVLQVGQRMDGIRVLADEDALRACKIRLGEAVVLGSLLAVLHPLNGIHLAAFQRFDRFAPGHWIKFERCAGFERERIQHIHVKSLKRAVGDKLEWRKIIVSGDTHHLARLRRNDIDGGGFGEHDG